MSLFHFSKAFLKFSLWQTGIDIKWVYSRAFFLSDVGLFLVDAASFFMFLGSILRFLIDSPYPQGSELVVILTYLTAAAAPGLFARVVFDYVFGTFSVSFLPLSSYKLDFFTYYFSSRFTDLSRDCSSFLSLDFEVAAARLVDFGFLALSLYSSHI